MTVNTWRKEILAICKTCPHFIDTHKARYRYRCGKTNLQIYHSHDCLKTFEIRKQAVKLCEEAYEAALYALIKGWGKKCSNCKKHHTMDCPNSVRCFSRNDKPYFEEAEVNND